jgi:hypothetical protein
VQADAITTIIKAWVESRIAVIRVIVIIRIPSGRALVIIGGGWRTPVLYFHDTQTDLVFETR